MAVDWTEQVQIICAMRLEAEKGKSMARKGEMPGSLTVKARYDLQRSWWDLSRTTPCKKVSDGFRSFRNLVIPRLQSFQGK